MRICVLADETIEEVDPSMYLTKYEWDLLSKCQPSQLEPHE